MFILPNVGYGFNTILHNIPKVDTKPTNVKVYMGTQDTQNGQLKMKEEKQSLRLEVPSCEAYCKATMIMTTSYQVISKRQDNQINGTEESPKMNSH